MIYIPIVLTKEQDKKLSELGLQYNLYNSLVMYKEFEEISELIFCFSSSEKNLIDELLDLELKLIQK